MGKPKRKEKNEIRLYSASGGYYYTLPETLTFPKIARGGLTYKTKAHNPKK